MTEKYFKKSRTEYKLKQYMEEAQKEFKSYEKNHSDSAKLAEAGEKLWGALNCLIELKTDKALKSRNEVKKAVYATMDSTLISIYERAYQLHLFFYGYADSLEEIAEIYKTVNAGLHTYFLELENKEIKRKKLVHV